MSLRRVAWHVAAKVRRFQLTGMWHFTGQSRRRLVGAATSTKPRAISLRQPRCAQAMAEAHPQRCESSVQPNGTKV
jgi:hypothetical protein